MDNALTMESTTDSPQQIADGLGIEVAAVVAPPVETTPVEVAPVAPATDVVADAPATEPVVVAPVAPAAEPVVAKPARAKDPLTGKFVAAPKAEVVPADELAASKAETETLKAELAALKKPAEPVAPIEKPAPIVSTIDVEAFRDPAVTAKYDARRQALGTEPKQEDFDDFQVFRSKEREYDRKLAALDANEVVEHQRAGETAAAADRSAREDVRAQFQTYDASVQSARARHADFDEVMTKASARKFAGTPYANEIQAAIIETADAETMYYIAGHLEELDLIQRQPSVRSALAQLGRVAAKATAAGELTVAPSGATQTGPAVAVVPPPAPVARVSAAPEPQGTMMGGGSSVSSTKLENAQSQADYNRMRNAQEAAKRGGRR